jgi:hypothetical protein
MVPALQLRPDLRGRIRTRRGEEELLLLGDGEECVSAQATETKLLR